MLLVLVMLRKRMGLSVELRCETRPNGFIRAGTCAHAVLFPGPLQMLRGAPTRRAKRLLSMTSP